MQQMSNPAKSSQSTVEILSESQMYRDYERAFTKGTGLPLRLQSPTLLNAIRHVKSQENPFCALLSKSDETCAASCAQCYALQCKVEEEAQFEPKTLKCFAGLCETAVPVRVGENVIAFLHTGQVLLQRPNKAKFKQIAATLLKWGAEVDLKKLEEHYFNTRVLTLEQYEALIRLLEIFAQHLAECGNALALQDTGGETPALARARSHIRDHSDDELSLAAVAHVANMSATYFSEKFKVMTGINFVDYVARTRVEKARHLLLNPKRRVSEVAYEVGFQSLSQFNRAFRRIAGESPRDYRAKLPLKSA
ncbi:MAG: PocR ligand-binding domain-containing protein [Gloeobacteraceae cyanobacterium ES-bin-144]|nr:PocR ligand-binding domain-containing protein [Verrucomicrobiales bacterium]